jgi:hypothetical protein
MSALPINFDPSNPIPNNPFYSLPTNYLQGPIGPLVIGSGLSVSAQGVISSSGGGGGGTVTAVTAGTGLAGGTITSIGTISIANTGATAGTYSFPTLSVNAQGQITSIISGNPVTSISVNNPLVKTGAATAPTISIQQASTTVVGAVQLNNSTSSTLTNQALTAAAGKSLQDQINAVAQGANGLILAGTLNASTGSVVTATTAGNLAGITAGNPVPAATPAINDYYLIVTTAAASYTPTGGTAISNVNVGDYILVSSGVWIILRVGPITGAYATTTTAGVVELATSAEAIAGTNQNVVLTPFTGAAAYVNRYCFTGPGQVLASNGNATYAALGAGIDGQVLTADASAPLGVKWAAGGGGGGTTINMTFSAPLSATTNPYVGGVVGVSINAASTAACGAVQLADTTATQTGVSTTLAITPAGAAATYIPYCGFTAKGQLIVGTGSNSFSVFPPGANGLALLACSTCTEGVYWGSPLQPATPTTIGGFCGFASGVGSNLSVGGGSLASVTGSANTALGSSAATSLTSGNANVAIGTGAMALATTACFNVAVGGCALYAETGGLYNTALGTCALQTQNGGSQNTAVGYGTGNSITTGLANTMVGAATADNLTSGSCNVLIGVNAGLALTSTSSNVMVGTNSGCNSTGGSNVFVGCGAGLNATTQSNQIVIGAGNSCTLGSANGGVTFAGSGTATWITMGNTAWSGTSDARLKEEVADLTLGLDFIDQIQPRTFNWKNDGSKAAGFIAQEAAAVVESHSAEYLGLVDDTNEYMGVAAGALIPVLVNAIKELKAEIEELKAKLS